MQSQYRIKRQRQGGDNYGSWNNGVQNVVDRINGRTLRYDHLKGEWH